MKKPFEGFLSDPKRLKISFFVFLSLTVIFLAAAGVLGYFYYLKNAEYNSLKTSYDSLNANYQALSEQLGDLESMTSATAKELQEQLDAETALNEKLAAENKALKADMVTAAAYLDFLEHLTDVIDTHDGFTGWTEAEHLEGVEIAEGTGDSDFVALVEWAWHHTEVDPTERLVAVWNGIIDGLDEALN